MIIDIMIEWIKVTLVLFGFWKLADEHHKKEWKYQILTVFMMVLCVLARVTFFENQSHRLIIEMELLTLYIVLYYQKERGRHLMYLVMVYVIFDFVHILIAVMTYWALGFVPEENHLLLGKVIILISYIILFFIFPKMMRQLRLLIGKKGFSIAEIGITVVLLFAKVVMLVFIGSDEGSNDAYPFYAFSFLSALVIGTLWIIDKRAREKQAQEQMQDYIRYEHRMREVLPTVGKALEKMENLSENSEEAAQIIEELKAVCRTDKEITQKEILTAKTFAPTGSPVFDSMLERILQEAAQDGVEVEIIARAKVSELLKAQKIEIGLFLQMFGDIYRNANKAVLKQGDGGRILIYMGYNRSGAYELSISDNGVPFPQHVLEHLGERGVTTDGTGHGLADTFSVLDKYKVSFYLKQNPGQNVVYSKTIRLVFDEEGHREIS